MGYSLKDRKESETTERLTLLQPKKERFLTPPPSSRVSDSVISARGRTTCISHKFPGEIRLPVQGPQFKNHSPKFHF